MKKTLAALALMAAALPVTVPVAAGAQARDGGTLTVGIASRNVTNGIDPAVIQGESTGWVLGQVAEGLLNYDQDMNIVPWLAKSWDISEDGLTYTFALQEGVRFHNGREMTAADVKFSLERMLDPETGSRRRQNLDVIETVEAPDDLTVVITLKTPFAPFLSNLVGVWAAVIPPESVNADNTVTTPMGTGPFTFVEWVQNDHLTVRKFADYWRAGEPHLDEVVFLPMPDDAARMTGLRTGALGLITSVPEQLLPVLTANESRGFNLLVAPGTSWKMAIMNNTRPPFDDVRVRKALSLALDREEIMLARTFGYGTIENQIWDEGSFWRMRAELPRMDRDAARALLAEAGYPDGLPIKIEIRSTYLDDAQVVQSQLNQAGFDATIEVADWAALKTRMQAGDYDMVISSAGWYPDPDSRYGRFYVKEGPANYFAGGYENAEVTALVAEGRTLTDPAARKVVYQKIFDIVQDEVPHAMLYFSPKTLAWADAVQDFRTDRQGDLAYADGGLAKVWLAE